MATTAPTAAWDARDAAAMQGILSRQRAAFTAELPVSAATRKARLQRALAVLLDNKDRLVAALSEDFGHRSNEMSLVTDIMASVKPLKHAIKHLDGWMKPENRPLDFPMKLLGARARVEFQPKGVIGIISPWNFPVNLTFAPLAGVLAAGNRAMIKPSEFTPVTSELMKTMLAGAFDETEIAVITGGSEAGKAFAGLAFDHLVFTGGTGIARHVMAAAAKNLVPLTLELGGKSPTIISRSADIGVATERIAMGKMMNAGQICLAPDYLIVPQESESEVIAGLKAATAKMYPTLLANPDYTSVLGARHRERLEAHVEDARAKGATIEVVNPANEDFTKQNTNKMPLHIIRNPTDEMTVMQEEIFGPLLPVRTYATVDGAIDEVNRRDRPLGLYWFGQDAAEQRRVLDRTISGGVTVNDVIFHVSAEELPFGGIGNAGMGSYHGADGFKEFSHAKSIYTQPKLDLAGLAGFKPPYGDKTRKALARELKA
ncbi:coniferyl aldehyde dehydrogenase [Polymorphobacter fuscus]|uniref:Aldehyde dehydrogenase n=1 Tax=Sandarakinorhabdus fusca TaxID=1439888 RepID=A0A7C9GPC6_9SPHN|nr:coniferyl aldehyde dehydrogenase [Polymorphobacter fuscus]KAB7647570.1 coniferyl aldehyde dehydrogenase [Polymorphobacter fuscus]MQT16836.1 aldehyde dehydrogenase family protein [Polymorphobacter fuscus]NJC09175.1 coniferyl-aldehyde dehydrogenase [Polymorphobacter fuscus]